MPTLEQVQTLDMARCLRDHPLPASVLALGLLLLCLVRGLHLHTWAGLKHLELQTSGQSPSQGQTEVTPWRYGM